MVFNRDTQPIDYVLLAGFAVAGYMIGSQMMRESYWILYPSTTSHKRDHDKCRSRCSGASGDIYHQCIDDCNMGGPLTALDHPSRRPETHGFHPIAFY
jgi:hypothetical protein